MLFAAHSGLRFVVLALAVMVVLYASVGLAGKREYSTMMSRLATAFAGVFHLQVLIGFTVLFTRPFSTPLIGHIFLTLLGAAVVQFVNTTMKRREVAQRSYGPHLVATLIALALVVFGVAAIGRGVLQSTL